MGSSCQLDLSQPIRSGDGAHCDGGDNGGIGNFSLGGSCQLRPSQPIKSGEGDHCGGGSGSSGGGGRFSKDSTFQLIGA